MTRCSTRRHVPRSPHPSRTKRPSIWNNPVYYLRSTFLPRILLSLLPLKSCPYPRTRWMLTPSRNHCPRPLRSSPSKHCGPSSFWSYSYMSAPQHYRRKTKTSNPIPCPYYSPRWLFHMPSGYRILRSPLYNCRRSLRLYLLRRNRFPRSTRHYWLYFPSRLLPAPSPPPLYIRPPFRIRSSCLILTFRRRRLTLPLRLNLLMRIIIFLVSNSISDFQSPGLG